MTARSRDAVRGGSYAVPVHDQAAATPPEAGTSDEARYVVVLRLVDGDRVEAESFPVEVDAHTCAEGFVGELGSGRWPRIGQRYVRPDAVVSVDVVLDDQPRWTGSTGRATSWTGRSAEP